MDSLAKCPGMFTEMGGENHSRTTTELSDPSQDARVQMNDALVLDPKPQSPPPLA